MNMPLNQANRAVATLGGGCFWCVEAVFDEVQLESEIRQFVAQHARTRWMEKAYSIEPLGLQVPDDFMFVGEAPQAVQVLRCQRFQMTQ